MLDLILSIFFGSLYLLTPTPIDIEHKVQITLSKPVSAVTDGATIQIDISHTVPSTNGFLQGFDTAKSLYPPGSISGMLSQSNGTTSVKFIYSGQVQIAKEGAILLLEPITKLPTRVKFDTLNIETDVELKHVNVYWKNFREF
jgi:hypothetical protein